MKQKTFYVYLHRKQSDGSVFYVGKGSAKRSRLKQGRSKYWKRIVAKHGFTVEIVAGFTDESMAFELESFLILLIGRDKLCNLTDGGEGCSGREMPESQRKKASAMLKGKPPIEAIEASKIANSRPIGTVCGMRFPSVRAAVSWLREHVCNTACSAGVSSSLRGKSLNAYGFVWCYTDANGNLLPNPFVEKWSGIVKKPVGTSCGLRFDSSYEAAKWLTDNGHPKARPSDINRNCNGHVNMVYGFRFGFMINGDFSPAPLNINPKKLWVCNSMGIVFKSVASAVSFMKERYSLSVSHGHISASIKNNQPDKNGVQWRIFEG